MTNMYDDFEKRFTNAPFFAGWVEFEVKPQAPAISMHKDLETLQEELFLIKENIEKVTEKQLRLSNLAKFYQ